jgi:hypothetical protein
VKWRKASDKHLESEDGRWLINKAMGPAGWTYMLVALNPSRIVCVGDLDTCKATASSSPAS